MRPCETPSPARGWCEALALAAVLAVLPGPGAAQAQAQPTPAATSPAVDPAFAAAATAFERLPEADRKLIQDGLIWTGDFTGAATGGFGPLTYRGIQAFQKRAGVKPDGILQPRERAALDQLAARARDAVRFTRVLDARSGARIGVPQKLLDRTRQSPAGTVFASADGAATLELLSPAGELQPLYDLLRTEQPGRKVAYKVLRPDWFVVSGDDRGRRFYTRVNATPGGLRGYTLTYPAGRAAEFDRIAIAVANSFETGPAATAGNANPGLLTPAPAPAGVPPGRSMRRACSPASSPVRPRSSPSPPSRPVRRRPSTGRAPASSRSTRRAGSRCWRFPDCRRRAAATCAARPRPTPTPSSRSRKPCSAAKHNFQLFPPRPACRRPARRACSRHCNAARPAPRCSTGPAPWWASSPPSPPSRGSSLASCRRRAGRWCPRPTCWQWRGSLPQRRTRRRRR